MEGSTDPPEPTRTSIENACIFKGSLPCMKELREYLVKWIEQCLKETSGNCRSTAGDEVKGTAVGDMLEYLRIDPDTVAVLPASEISARQGIEEMRIVAGMIGKCARGSIKRTIALHSEVVPGMSFRRVSEEITDELTEIPANAIAYLQKRNALPKHIAVLPHSATVPAERFLEHAGYCGFRTAYSILDPRKSSEKKVQDSAEKEVRKMIRKTETKMSRKFDGFAIDYDSADPWKVYLYHLMRDFIEMFKTRLSARLQEMNVPESRVRIDYTGGMVTSNFKRRLYTMEVMVDPHTRDFFDYSVDQIAEMAERLTDEATSIVVGLSQLQQDGQSYREYSDPALKEAHDPRKSDGVTVEFFEPKGDKSG